MADKQNSVIITDKTDFESLFNAGSAFLKDLDVYLYSTMYRDDDLVILFDGVEGSGKSKIMRILAAYCVMRIRSWGFSMPDFSEDNIHFDLDEYKKTAEKMAKKGVKGWINVLDESRKVANRRAAMQKSTIDFTNYLSECRSANQIHFLALPAYHDIDSNIAVWRQKFVVHVEKRYTKNTDPTIPVPIVLERGYFKVYADTRKLTYCYYHKVKYTYPKNADFAGRFSSALAYTDSVDVSKYNAKKEKYRLEKYGEEGEQKPTNKTELRKEMFMGKAIANLEAAGYKLEHIAQVFGMCKDNIIIKKRNYPQKPDEKAVFYLKLPEDIRSLRTDNKKYKEYVNTTVNHNSLTNVSIRKEKYSNSNINEDFDSNLLAKNDILINNNIENKEKYSDKNILNDTTKIRVLN